MADSELDLTQPRVFEIPAETVAIVVRNNDGTTRTALRNKGGKFVRKPKPMPEAREVTRLLRTNLWKVTKDYKKTDLQRIWENIITIATNTDPNPKAMQAAVQAAEWVMMRTVGKPNISDEERDALQKAGVTIVVIPPPELMHPEVIVEGTLPVLTPSFIEAEVVSTDEGKTHAKESS